MNNIFAAICKVDPDQRMVYGYASTEAMDSQGEVVTKAAMAEALEDYMKFANIREMHQPSAVGVAKSAEMDDKGCFLAAKVVDDDAWNKVKEGVYKGFSIGGKAVTKVDGTITSLRLSEISLVDRPANPEAVIEVWKADGIATATADASPSAIDALAELLNKGTITPERLIELAKADAAEPAADADPAAEPAAAPADESPQQSDTPAAEGEAPSDAAGDAAKADAIDDVKKGFEGEEVWDAGRALSALDQIMSLLYSERAENEQMPEQIASLEAAVQALKEFIVSEIQEDNSPAAQAATVAADAVEDMAYADKGGDVAKYGKTISAKNMEKVQAVHDSVVAMGAACKAMDKSDDGGELAKADVIGKLVEEAIAKALSPMQDELKKAHAEIERMKNLPLPGKALLKAVAKSDDVVSDNASASAVIVKDGGGNTNEVASLIKMIHQQGGAISR
jgi:phage head maturation protease